MRTYWVACLSVALSLAVGGAAEPEPPSDMPRSPEESLRCFRIPQGLRVELVAAEPLVVDPIAIAFGPEGKLWVVEMGDYPSSVEAPGGRIRFLTDTNGDGRYDTATVFLDGLSFPTGVMPWRNGVLVTCAPEIFYAEDTDRDGRADRRETLYRGFHTGNPQHTVNGLQWGLDNWIHGANGDSGGIVESVQTGRRLDIFGHDFRIRPVTGELTLETGMSQFGRCRDDWGNWFGGNSARPLWHNVIEDRYLTRNRRWTPPNPAVALTEMHPPVSPISRPQPRLNEFGWSDRITSGCGACVYRDDRVAWPGSVFICEPAHNLVHQRVLHPSLSTFVSEPASDAEEFLASTDNWFRPTQVRTGPDGGLWVVDMYRAVIEHPEFFEPPPGGDAKQAPPPPQSLRLGSDRGRIYRVVSNDRPPRRPASLRSACAAELVEALDSPNGPQRDLAQQLLVERQVVEAAAPLRKLFLGSPHANRRLQALSALDGIGQVDESLILAALGDPHAAVRRHAVLLAEPRLQREGVRRGLRELAANPDVDAQVRLQLACTLGEWRDPQAGAALAKMLVRDADDLYIVAAVMSAAETHVQWILPGLIRNGGGGWTHLQMITDLIPAALAAEDQTALANTLLELTNGDDESRQKWRWEVLTGLLQALDRQGSSLKDLESSSAAELQTAIRKLSPLFDAARQVASDSRRPTELRALAVGLLGSGLNGQAADIERLRELLTLGTDVEVQLAVVERLSNTRLPEVPQWLLTDFSRRGPRLRGEILDALLSRKEWTVALLDALESQRLVAADLGASQRDRLELNYYAELRRRAATLLNRGAMPRNAVVAEYLPAVERSGDASRGELLFNKHCASCHRAGKNGGPLGPDLKDMTSRTREMLLIDILDPNRRVDPKFLGYLAVTEEGRIYSGIVAREAGAALSIISPEGKQHDLLRSELLDLKSTGRSIMPEGLERLLPEVQDMADVLTYLRSKKQ